MGWLGVERIHQADIRRTINGQLEMTIADVMHCENLPNHVVDSPTFWLVLKCTRFVGSPFKFHAVSGGDLLDINCKTALR